MSQRLTTPSYAVLGLGAISLLGYTLRWAIEASGTPPHGTTTGPSFVFGAVCLVIAGLSFALAEQWPVRIGGLSQLLGLGLLAGLPAAFWLGLSFVSFCLILVVAVLRKMNRG